MQTPSLNFGLNLRCADRAARLAQVLDANPVHSRNSVALALLDIAFQVLAGRPPEPGNLPLAVPAGFGTAAPATPATTHTNGRTAKKQREA